MPNLLKQILGAILLAYSACAGTEFINEGGTDGAYSRAFFNITANQGSGKTFRPGDTIHITGTLTNPIYCWPRLGGTSEHPTVVISDVPVAFSAPTISVTNGINYMWVYADGSHDVVFDGGSNRAVMQCTDNGTGPAFGGLCHYQNNVNGFYFANAGGSNLVIQNWTCSNLYNHAIQSLDPAAASTFVNGTGWAITVRSNSIYNSESGIRLDYDGGGTGLPRGNYTILSNSLMGFDQGIIVAAGNPRQNNPRCFNVLIANNRIDGMWFYEMTNAPTAANPYHRDPIFIWNGTGGRPPREEAASFYTGLISNLTICRNFIGPNAGSRAAVDGIAAAGSAGMFFHNYCSNQVAALHIYNNIVALVPPSEYGDGSIVVGDAGGEGNFIANNTIIGWHTNVSGGGAHYCQGNEIVVPQNCLVANNLQYDGQPGLWAFASPITNDWPVIGTTNIAAYFSGLSVNHNVYAAAGAKPWFMIDIATSFGTPSGSSGRNVNYRFHSSAAWRAAGFDRNSSEKMPALQPGAFIPASTDTVIHNAGANLHSLGITDDFSGNPRPPAGPWDIGAYQVQ